MSTTLPLFWHLSSASKKERIDSSVKLIIALEHFQAQFTPKDVSEASDDDDEPQEGDDAKSVGLDALNAQDVSYSIRRLVRGLASPRESSRLGFAVALTELLSRIDTVTCSQILALILDSSKTQGSMTGQEERDVLFARLFGLTAIIRSGLLFRDTPLPSSASSSTLASNLSCYKAVLAQLIALGEKKSWLRESAWWSISLAVDALNGSQIPWKEDAVESTTTAIFLENKTWTPEKVALTLKLQKLNPSRDWRNLLLPTFKHPELLSTGNLTSLARILKESNADDDEESDLPRSGAWKPQVHFVWDMLLDEVLSDSATEHSAKSSFPEFFRIVVDESLFSSTTSHERKYWGFQIFQKALPRVNQGDMPMLFTKNFMRSWINHLSNSDRYLHKAARQVAMDIQTVVKENPTIGFTLILQLTGVNGNRQFDRLTKTKTVDSILASMDNDGIQNYINYLFKQVNDKQDTDSVDIQAINARRAWIIDQLAALIRNGAIPKSDEWIQLILDWLVVHGMFIVTKKSDKSPLIALRGLPSPSFSDELRQNCRDRLLSCLAELTGQTTLIRGADKIAKTPAVASNEEFWVSRVLSTIEELEKDTKHARSLVEVDEDEQRLRVKARQVTDRLRQVSGDRREAAKGAELLLSATLLYHHCADEVDSEVLENCIDGASRMFPTENKKKKPRKSATNQDDSNENEALKPVDVLVDIVIGVLERATAYMRAVANQVFSLLSGSLQESTFDLILTQLEQRGPAELLADEDEDEVMEGSDEESQDEEGQSGDNSSESDKDEDLDEAEDLELRRKIEEALRVNGVDAATDASDEDSEELMDDDQMLAIDEQLAAAFRIRASEKLGKDVNAQREATHFKNRVLDLLETFIRKQPTSPLIIRLILPLVELTVGSGSDEKQLADKATGILRSRIGKSKEVPSNIEEEQAVQVLQQLHSLARKASSDVLMTLSQCSLYLCKVLHHFGVTKPIQEVYRQSLVDFVSRKASRLNSSFFQDFIRRHADVAWDLREDILKTTSSAVNVYRQSQAFQLLQTLISQAPMANDHRTEILDFMLLLRCTLYDVMVAACEQTSSTLSPPQMKELFKVGLATIRQSKRVSVTPEELSTIWDPPIWTTLASKLAMHGRFKSSTGLQSMCKQMAQMTTPNLATSSQKTSSSTNISTDKAPKRKVGTLDDGEEQVGTSKKAQRKRIKKAKA